MVWVDEGEGDCTLYVTKYTETHDRFTPKVDRGARGWGRKVGAPVPVSIEILHSSWCLTLRHTDRIVKDKLITYSFHFEAVVFLTHSIKFHIG